VDVPALARTRLDSDVATSIAYGRDVVASVTGVAADPQLSWPPGGFTNIRSLDDLAASGARRVVLQTAALPPTQSLNYTPNAGAPLESRSGSITALLYDETLAHIVASADRTTLAAASKPAPLPTSSAGTDGNTATPSPTSDASPTASPTTARLLEQRFLAETALITAEHPTQSRDVIVAPPTSWDPVPGLATALVADTGRVPWLTSTTLDAVNADDSVARDPLTYPDAAANAELPRSYLAGIISIRRDLSTFRSILTPPIGPTAVSLEDATMRAESAWWRGDLSGGLALREQVASDLSDKLDAVSISSSQRLITLASRRGTIPVTISNNLDQAVVIGLQLSAVSKARLLAPPTDNKTIAAGRKLTVEVKAVVNQAGLFPVKAQLLTPDGEPYGSAVTLRLRSTAYGQLALGITAGALSALLVAIVFRLVRRNRRRESTRAASSG
ncbi:MAG: DUF6049 family protein, partial [Actinomycetes bacterium]